MFSTSVLFCRVNIARSARNERPMLFFSQEITDQGHRYFVVDDVDTFYEKYIRMGARDRLFAVVYPAVFISI